MDIDEWNNNGIFKYKHKYYVQFLMWKNRGSVGADLDNLDAERAILTDPKDNRKRRTLQLHKQNNSWGFTLQTYGIKHKKTNEIDLMTYVDYVDIHGAAYLAGLRKGDVIISVNGKSVELSTHQELVQIIKSSAEVMRLVVLFEDCCKKVELYDRIIKLKNVLSFKINELKMLEMQEREILDGICQNHNLSRFDLIRQSIYSKASSNSWDDISLINSPQTLRHLPHSWATSYSSDTFTPKSSIGEDNSVEDPIDFDESYIDITYADSDSDSGACINDDCFENSQSQNNTDQGNQSKCRTNNNDQSENTTSVNQSADVLVHNVENEGLEENLKVHNSDNENIMEPDLNRNKTCDEISKNRIQIPEGSETVVLEQEDNNLKDIETKIHQFDEHIVDKNLVPFLGHGKIYINEKDEHTKL